ncbi:MAG: DUF1854 domain-containing protein [Ruminococcaceae bacterium]|nr:DUF1854 domain-containing protein [Oscillospiraceae bacterium]
MALFIDGPEAKIEKTGDTTVTLRLFRGDVYEGLEPRRLFPLSGLTRYITLLDSDQKEKAIIRNLDGLDEESRRAVVECLNEYYLIPKITAVNQITEKFGILSWHCETDHGRRSFRIRNRHSDIKMLYDGRVLIRDSNDNRYEIEDIKKLDKRSRRLLASEL